MASGKITVSELQGLPFGVLLCGADVVDQFRTMTRNTDVPFVDTATALAFVNENGLLVHIVLDTKLDPNECVGSPEFVSRLGLSRQ